MADLYKDEQDDVNAGGANPPEFQAQQPQQVQAAPPEPQAQPQAQPNPPQQPTYEDIQPGQYQDVDFGGRDFGSGTPVPGQPGKFFVHHQGRWQVSTSPGGAPPQPNSFAPGGTGDPNAPPPTPYTATPNMQEMQRQAILSEIQKAQGPVSINDADIQAQLNPFAAIQERGRKVAETEAAERASTMGLGSSGALDVERRGVQERAGLATANYGAGLVGEKLKAQRDSLKQYLDLNAKTIDADQARMLQKQLAEMDAAIRREGLSLQADLGRGDLDLRRDLGNKGLQNDIMRMLLQDKQAGNDLGYRIGATEADNNRAALLAAMGLGG